MSGISHSPRCRDAPVGQTPARRTAIGKTMHHLLDAFCEALAAHRKYERLVSMGMRHDPALRVALSETSQCREASARRASSLTRSEHPEAAGKPLSLAGTA
jgi:hypothetical protein